MSDIERKAEAFDRLVADLEADRVAARRRYEDSADPYDRMVADVLGLVVARFKEAAPPPAFDA